MPFVPAPNIVMVEVRALLAGQHVENRFMVDVLTAVTPTLVDDVANAVNVWAQGTYFDHLPAAVQLSEVVATDMSVAEGTQVTIAPTGTFVGALDTPAMPNEVTFCISLRSGSRGRSARGRAYVLAITRDAVTGNDYLAARADQHVSDFQALIDAMTTAGWALVVVSYISGGAPRVGGPVYFPITTPLYTDLTVDSMRKRKPGVGS